MKLSLRLAIATALLPLNLLAQSPTPDWDAAGKAWFAHVQYLASDELQGRRPGTPGFDAAVAYVQKQFQSIGILPAGSSGYLQPVPLDQATIDPAKSSVALCIGATQTPLELTKEITLSPHITPGGPIDAPLVFIGYGLDLPAKHINNLANLDLHGKVVVFYNASPANVLGPLRAYSRVLSQRWKALQAAGAIGVISFTPPRNPPAPTPPGPRPTYLISDPSLETLPGLRLNATLTAAGAEKLLATSGHTFAEIKALADQGKPLPIFPFNGNLHATTTVQQLAHLAPPNVIGELEGSDRKLKHEYIVISAHLDHLGVGRAVDGDTIYNGAMDNASGVASVIEAAKLLAAGPRPKRSILFIALTGEELGELGSQYFATKPTVKKSEIVADLNMDMYLPLFPLRYLEIQGLGESTLGNDARAICQLNDVEPQFDKQPDENRFIRSDQVNFVNQGIPALAFKFGWTPDSPEMKTFNEWVKARYHQPSDDLQQPIDKVAAAQFTHILGQLAARVANNPQRPTWYPESSFAPH
ncbi:M28 family peptidase [Granulicella sp. dw_53]|uniref:M28 family peptidase n=1 Tax=Granulicella sp. dw_53 TaxID=2719792 RepID=UPI001BD40810|nr:M28 family peptidase [Granulicella sp. dw_53]